MKKTKLLLEVSAPLSLDELDDLKLLMDLKGQEHIKEMILKGICCSKESNVKLLEVESLSDEPKILDYKDETDLVCVCRGITFDACPTTDTAYDMDSKVKLTCTHCKSTIYNVPDYIAYKALKNGKIKIDSGKEYIS